MAGPMRNRGPVEKMEKGTFKKSMGRLLKYCKKYWGLMLGAILFGIVGVVAQIVGPNKIQDLTNLIAVVLRGETIDMSAVTDICVFLVCLYAIGTIFSYVKEYIAVSTSQKIAKNLRKDISKKINRMPLNYFDTHLHGDTLSRVTNEVDTIAQSLDQSVSSLFSNVLLFLL